MPSIFPLTALRGTESARLSIGLFASRADQIRALIEAAGPEAAILADREGRAYLDETGLAGQVTPRAIETVRGVSGNAVVVSGAEGLRQVAASDLNKASIFGISDEMASAMPQLLAAGASVTLADARAPAVLANDRRPDLLRFIDAAVHLLEAGLAGSGRDVTRTKLLAAIRSVSISPPDWPDLDYRKHALTGTASVKLRTIRSAEGAGR